MIVTCPSCSARYRVPADRIQGKGARITCPSCAHRFVVYKGDEQVVIGQESQRGVAATVSKGGEVRRAATIDDEDEQPTSLMPRGSSLPPERNSQERRSPVGMTYQRAPGTTGTLPKNVPVQQEQPAPVQSLRPDVAAEAPAPAAPTQARAPQDSLRRSAERIVPASPPKAAPVARSQTPFLIASAVLAVIALVALVYLVT